MISEFEISKPYTPVMQSLSGPSDDEKHGRTISFIIKHYETGAMTSMLKKIEIGKQSGVFPNSKVFPKIKTSNPYERQHRVRKQFHGLIQSELT
jgi:hypothetical protein